MFGKHEPMLRNTYAPIWASLMNKKGFVEIVF